MTWEKIGYSNFPAAKVEDAIAVQQLVDAGHQTDKNGKISKVGKMDADKKSAIF